MSMVVKKSLQLSIYTLYKLGLLGKIKFSDLDILEIHSGPAIIIANHQTKIDLFIPILLNSILKRQVYSTAAAYAFRNIIKKFVAEQLNIIFVTKSLNKSDLGYVARKLALEASEGDISDAYSYYRDLAKKYNTIANERIEGILVNGGMLFTFAQPYQPFFEMEKASEGIGRLICRYPGVPVFPVSIVDKSVVSVESRTRNDNKDLKRIDLLTDKKRRYSAGIIEVTIKNPLLLRGDALQDKNYRGIVDEMITYISLDMPVSLRGYYKNFQLGGKFRFFSSKNREY